MLGLLKDWMFNKGLSASNTDLIARTFLLIVIIVFSIISYYVAKSILLRVISKVINKTTTQWDDIILSKKVFNHLAHLVPGIVIYLLIPIPFSGYDELISFMRDAVAIYTIGVSIAVINAFLNASLTIYQTYEVSNKIPIVGFIQVIKILIYFTCGIFIISILLDKTPVYLFSSLGALTAVLMFIFKDAILGFVAGIQLSANQLVAKGDWVEVPKYDANGTVVEIALTTVKVQNFDQTITTVPTYALISESFKNWRGMLDSGGRRIKRAINIDLNTIQFCSEEMLERYSKIQLITDYIQSKKIALAEYNKQQQTDDTSLVNGRRITNVGTFRAYVEAYLKHHASINHEMTFLIRQLAPSEMGLPIEIYVFSKEQEWAKYESIQADIFDHILAIVPEFDLQIFQHPTGRDFDKLMR